MESNTVFESSIAPKFSLVNGYFTEVNKQFADLLGYQTAEVIGRPLIDFVASHSRDEILALRKSQGKSRSVDMRLKCADSSEIWVRFSARKKLRSGSDWVWGYVQNIGESAKNIELMRLREEQYISILDSMEEEVSRENPDGDLIYVNDAFCKYYGVSKEKAIGSSGLEVVYPEDREVYSRGDALLSPDSPVYQYDVRVRDRNGDIRWVHGTRRAFFNEQGELLEYQEVGSDITDLKRHEKVIEKEKLHLQEDISLANEKLKITNERLKRSNKYLEMILQGISESIVVINRQGETEFVNAYLESEWADELQGLLQSIQGKALSQKNNPISAMLKNGNAFREYEMAIDYRKNSTRCMISGMPILGEGEDEYRGVLIIRTLKEINKLVNRMSGFNARFTFQDIVTQNTAMKEIIRYARQSADSEAITLIEGESGTGKEMFAQAIHNESLRKDGPFIAINCGAIPNELIESELFGYDDASFTGAKKGGKPGKFELASGGTIFLDEIGEMSLQHQISLLRVLQERRITRIGGDTEIDIDVKIICATNRDLYREMLAGNFRQDLYYRLNVVNIRIPPLRERMTDIPILIQHFVRTLQTDYERAFKQEIILDDKTRYLMEQYSWPGNIRELRNLVERTVYGSGGRKLQFLEFFKPRQDASNQVLSLQETAFALTTDNPEKERTSAPNSATVFSSKAEDALHYQNTLAQQEKEYIESLLEMFDGNISQIARKIGMSRKTLYRKMKALGVER